MKQLRLLLLDMSSLLFLLSKHPIRRLNKDICFFLEKIRETNFLNESNFVNLHVFWIINL